MDWLQQDVKVNRGVMLLVGAGIIALTLRAMQEQRAASEHAFNLGAALGYGAGELAASSSNAQAGQLPPAQPQQVAPGTYYYEPPDAARNYGLPTHLVGDPPGYFGRG